MNKIIVDEEIKNLENMEVELYLNQESCKLYIKGNNKIIVKKSNLDLTLILEDEANLDILFKDVMLEKRIVNILAYNNTYLNYKESFSSSLNTELLINNKILGNNNKSLMKIRTISKDKKVKINVLADVNKETVDNELIEDIKGINEGGLIEVLPNMEINTSEVMANHYVTISNLSPQDLFYLESKGLSEEASKKLILEGFLKSVEVIKDA